MRCKSKISIVVKKGLVYMATLLLSGACATVPDVVNKRLFFPFFPEIPRVEWKATYVDQHSFPKSVGQRRIDAFLGKSPSVGFSRPMDIASNGKGLIYVTDPDSRNVFIYDTINYKITVLDEDGSGMFTLPLGIAVDKEGRIYVSDRFKKKVLVFAPDKSPLFTIGGSEGEMDAPVGVAVDSINKKVYVTDVKKQAVNVYDTKGKLLDILDRDKDERMMFNFPVDVDVFPDGSIAVVDTMNAKIHIIDSKGDYVRNFGKRGDSIDAFEFIKAVAIDKEGHLYITDVGSNSVKVYNAEGVILLTFGGGYRRPEGISPGGFIMIAGVSTDENNGIYIADQRGGNVQVFQYLDKEYLSANPLPESYRSADEVKVR